MIVDSSALIAIALSEPTMDDLLGKLERATASGIGTPTLVETGIVLSHRLRGNVDSIVARLLLELNLVEVPFGDRHWREALRAHRRFGRGRHRANLNFGDCLTYAVASLAREPLLFTGDDFAATDLASA